MPLDPVLESDTLPQGRVKINAGLTATEAAQADATQALADALAAQNTANAAIPAGEKGAANGVATLDADGLLGRDVHWGWLRALAGIPRDGAVLPLPLREQRQYTTQFTPTHEQQIALLVPVPLPLTIAKIGIRVDAAQSGVVVRLGLYEYPAARSGVGAGNNPAVGDLIIDAGTVDASTTGTKTITLPEPVPVTSGAVWFSYATQGDALTTFRFREMEHWPNLQGVEAFLPGSETWCYVRSGVPGAFPETPLSSGARPSITAPRLVVGEVL